MDELERQAPGLATRRDQDASVFAAGEDHSRVLLRLLQRGERLGMPHSRPMPSIGAQCHELRVADERQDWRIVYRSDEDAIVLLAVFSKKTRKTPRSIITTCKDRLKRYGHE